MDQAAKQSANTADDARRHGNERSVTAATTIVGSSAKRVRTITALFCAFCSYKQHLACWSQLCLIRLQPRQ